MGCPAAVTRMLTPEEIASIQIMRVIMYRKRRHTAEKTESIRKNRSKSNRITNNAVRFSVADDFSQQPRCRINTHENPRNLKFYRYFRFRGVPKSSFKYYLAVQPKKCRWIASYSSSATDIFIDLKWAGDFETAGPPDSFRAVCLL